MADQLEGRNPVIECLCRKKRMVHQIWLDRNAKVDKRMGRLLALAEEAGVRITRVERRWLDQKAQGRVHNGVIASVEVLEQPTTRQLLESLYEQQVEPFIVLADALSYEHNLGALMRSALGFGVHGLVMPTRRGASLSPVVQRVAMGAAEEIPVVRESLFVAAKHLAKDGIRLVGADMDGLPMSEVNLRGSVAVVLGSEGSGLSPKLRERCDAIVSIPLAGGLESLNVSVAGALLMYEKRRQDGWFDGSSG